VAPDRVIKTLSILPEAVQVPRKPERVAKRRHLSVSLSGSAWSRRYDTLRYDTWTFLDN